MNGEQEEGLGRLEGESCFSIKVSVAKRHCIYGSLASWNKMRILRKIEGDLLTWFFPLACVRLLSISLSPVSCLIRAIWAGILSQEIGPSEGQFPGFPNLLKFWRGSALRCRTPLLELSVPRAFVNTAKGS